jgi:PhnB protein
MDVQAYLSFEGRAEEALDFYKGALGAEVDMVMHFRDAPPEVQGQVDPKSRDKVMHAAFRIGDTQLMATDGNCSGATGFSGISLTYNAKDIAAAEKAFNALAEGGKVGMPLAETFFAHRFGTVADRFGVNWMVLNSKMP